MLGWALVAFLTANATLGNCVRAQESETSRRSAKIAKEIAGLHELRASGSGFAMDSAVTEPHKRRLLAIAAQSEEARAEVIKALIETLGSSEPEGVWGWDYGLWVAACYALGELKATEAIDLLVEHLTDARGLEGLQLDCPAPEALVKIGPPVIHKLKEAALKPGANARFRGLAVVVLGRIGDGQAREALQEMATTESDHWVLDRIHKLLDRQR